MKANRKNAARLSTANIRKQIEAEGYMTSKEALLMDLFEEETLKLLEMTPGKLALSLDEKSQVELIKCLEDDFSDEYKMDIMRALATTTTKVRKALRDMVDGANEDLFLSPPKEKLANLVRKHLQNGKNTPAVQ